MNKTIPLCIAGLIFVLVALTHLVRIIYDIKIEVAGNAIPMHLSYLGFVVALSLSAWMFLACKK